MRRVKISLVNGDITTTPCSIAFLKHIQGVVSTPEMAIDARLEGRLTSAYKDQEAERHFIFDTADVFAFPRLHVLNFHEEDLPFSYSSIDSYARRILRHTLKAGDAVSIATVMHGPGSGLDASEAMETLLSALHRELQLRGDFGNLGEIILVEKDKKVFNRLRDRLNYLLNYKEYVVGEGRDVFLNPQTEESGIDSESERIEKLSKHVFVAMPFAKEFDNVYYFGIKGTVEQRRLKCERVDHDKFTGDIINRIKERIAAAEFVVADITGGRANVFYEVGYADGLRKKIVFISQNRDAPFDVSTQRQIFYDPQAIFDLTKELGELFDALTAAEQA